MEEFRRMDKNTGRLLIQKETVWVCSFIQAVYFLLGH
jgi:hypothetical protein